MRFVPSTRSLLVACLVAASPSFSAAAQGDPSLLASMRKAGQVKVAVGSLPPWMSVSPSGEPVGYLVEILNLALKGLDLPPMTATLTAWEGMIPGLQARQFDLVAPGAAMNEARCKVVAFSSPVWVQQDAMYVLPNNPKKITGYATIAGSPDIKLAVLSGSAQEAYALKQGIKPEQLVRVTDMQGAVSTVRGGRANAFAAGQFSVANASERGVEVVVDAQSPINAYGVMFRKEDIQTRDAFNRQLEALRANGKMKELYAVKYKVPNWDVLAKFAKPSDLVPSCE